MSYIKYLLIALMLIGFTGCDSEKYVYIQPEYPKISNIRKVSNIQNAYIRNKCLWINLHNTNLCKNDLEIVLRQIEKLRINEKTCISKIDSYNDFVKKQSSNDKKYKLK